jgi:hypothetical protein
MNDSRPHGYACPLDNQFRTNDCEIWLAVEGSARVVWIRVI